MGTFLILILLLSIKSIFSQAEYLLINARGFKVDLSNENDPFFHDICVNLKKLVDVDLTLDYRRKYYFFKNINKQINFQRPLRNNSNDCFMINNSFEEIFTNYAIIIVCIAIFQILLIYLILIKKFSECFNNSPLDKINLLNRKKKKTGKNIKIENNNNIIKINKGANSYSRFTAEEKKEENFNNFENTDMAMIPNKITDSTNPMNEIEVNNNENDKQNSIEEEREGKVDSKLELNSIKEIKIPDRKEQNNLDEIDIPKEKSQENYTFGFNFGTKINISNNNMNNINNNQIEKKENSIEKKEDKMKRIRQIYDEINPSKKKEENINKNINNPNSITNELVIFSPQRQVKKLYVREEYFYFKYLLARIEDKRSVCQIYRDLLEHNQIIFKFYLNSFNIYEDRKIQFLYYLTKIELYFLINCLLIKSSDINDIYDNKSTLFSNFIRSLKATIITYFISLFLYKLTNIKKVLLKRRYKLINMKVSNSIIREEITKLTRTICENFLYNKIIVFIIFIALFVIYSFYISFSFCKTYPNSQHIILECVAFSILISQLIPFIACWIPAFLRRQAIDLKEVALYDLAKFIEFFFVD